MIGTNDVDQTVDLPNAPARLKNLVDTIFAHPGVGSPTVYLASVPPNRTSAPDPANTDTFNAAVPGVAQALRDAGRDVTFVDQYADINNDYALSMNADNLHPNARGNGLLAQNWYEAVELRAVPEPSAALAASIGGGAFLLSARRQRRREPVFRGPAS
jgi:lysophospholipase L1-like esterase